MNQMNYHLIAIPNHRVSDHVRALANKHRYWDSTDWRDCQRQLYHFRYGISPSSHLLSHWYSSPQGGTILPN